MKTKLVFHNEAVFDKNEGQYGEYKREMKRYLFIIPEGNNDEDIIDFLIIDSMKMTHTSRKAFILWLKDKEFEIEVYDGD